MIKITYIGRDGSLTRFEISGASEAQLLHIKEICGGYYVPMASDAGIRLSTNKRIYENVEAFVETQARVSARPAAGGHSAKSRILVPTGFSDEKILNLLGPVTLTGRGVAFMISANHPSTHGDHLLGYEGTEGQYAYYTK